MKLRPDTHIPSPDTILRGIKKLVTENIEYQSDRGIKYSYKKERGYFPGVATIGPLIVGLENRDGNANVRFHQADTLKRIFQRLENRGVFINRCRMDCGSYSKEIIATVRECCNKFYIRASRYESLSNEVSGITDWKEVEPNVENCEVTSIPFTAFMKEENFRLVIQRKRKKECEKDLFDGKFVYRCIVSNDWDSTEEKLSRSIMQEELAKKVRCDEQ